MSEIPKGCFQFINHNKILKSDIYNDRPTDQKDISTEQAVSHKYIVEKVGRLFRKSYWVVWSATTYEMCGNYIGPWMGGRTWGETDLTGLEWRFENEEDANNFAFN